MQNSNSSDGTAADSDMQPIATTSADIEANPMLADGCNPQLTEKDFRHWLMGLFIQQYPKWDEFNKEQAIKSKELAEKIISFGKQYGLLNSNLR